MAVALDVRKTRLCNKSSSAGRPNRAPYQGKHMVRYLMAALVASALSATSVARITPFPKTFHTQMVQTNGTSLYVRIGGKGPAVVLLHGFGDTGVMWGPLAAELVKVRHNHGVGLNQVRGQRRPHIT